MTTLKNIVLAAVSFVIFSNITHAQAVKASYSKNAEEPLKVKYLGDDGEYLLFQVTLQSSDHAKAKFAIEDKTEGEIYSSGFVTDLKVSTVKIEKKDADQVLNFKLIFKMKTYSKSFSVNTNLVKTTTVSEGDITRL
ncbi:MAG: hypothetical protein ABI707_03095 [Ferruginibacter sp.]